MPVNPPTMSIMLNNPMTE